MKWCFVFLYCIPSIVRDKYLNRNFSVGYVWAPAGRSEGEKLRVSRRQLIRRDTAATVTRTACVRVLDTTVHNETRESSSGSLRLCTSHRQSRDREHSQTEGFICASVESILILLRYTRTSFSQKTLNNVAKYQMWHFLLYNNILLLLSGCQNTKKWMKNLQHLLLLLITLYSIVDIPLNDRYGQWQ